MTYSSERFFNVCCLEQKFSKTGDLTVKRFVDDIWFYDVDVANLVNIWVDYDLARWVVDGTSFCMTDKAYSVYTKQTYSELFKGTKV